MIRRHEMVAVVRAGAGDLVRWENTRFESHSLRCIYRFFLLFFFCISQRVRIMVFDIIPRILYYFIYAVMKVLGNIV